MASGCKIAHLICTVYQLITIFHCSVYSEANKVRKAGNDSLFPPDGYQTNSPYNEDEPHNSSIHTGFVLWLEAVTKIDVSVMEFEVYGYVVQEWKDSRLKGIYDHPFILREINKIWLPDAYCVNCRESTMSSSQGQNAMARIDSQGDIYYSQRVRMSASCPMNLKNFPFDKQYCTINFASYSYNKSFLRYHWNGPVVLSNHELDQFKVQGVTTTEIETEYKSGTYTVLSAEFLFVRRMGFYIIQVYLPTAMLVSLSWITFYMDPSDIGDRLTIGITLILTMIFLLGYINTSLPKVSYIKAVDWYLISSLIIIILAVVEGVIAYGLYFKYSKKEEKKFKGSKTTIKLLAEDGKDDEVQLVRLDSIRKRPSVNLDINDPSRQSPQNEATEDLLPIDKSLGQMEPNGISRSQRRGSKRFKLPACFRIVDTCSKFLFPLLFLVYNVLYFWIYHDAQWKESKERERK